MDKEFDAIRDEDNRVAERQLLMSEPNETAIDFHEIRARLSAHHGEVVGGESIIEWCFDNAAELDSLDPEGQWRDSFLKQLVSEGMVTEEKYLFKVRSNHDQV